ncbi:bifunctional phosphopantothenoylcysteine decarboxylase/phosphopantothenate--cysteine ligase CoaBC [Clostridium uliginosum]|uniref:Coenzyme A biosynthesis bifunctional protein CoaBC n=1 Tax=Clostridium uliginosum TaxID=119641 RepID=A0A1I1LPY3_9CLOT|nr:bifunctional phosphopantothenoylcysteine decarboxylase/phosphopantothenate--cysteine ligase CoaBC [Clostridium uliginosum]SFC72353.1 phosphopantothenoylcysteine decarboxylase / phosphopantothenate--cysteine ligase [Clostridium uliginosum]
MKRCVVLGVSGGIAVYKALEIISLLRKKDIEVRVIMTKSATEFVTPLSFQALSQNMVTCDMFSEPKAWEIQHISLAEKADVFLVAPATANIIGKVANGIADDMLSTTIMATNAKVIFAPAMNTNMYNNPIVQKNIEKLKSFGYEFIEPAAGRLACGSIGKGKLERPEVIVDRILSEFIPKDLINKNVLVTAGPTISPIDPVRFITNRSSGKMGYAIAKEARNRGAKVTLISGPTSLEIPSNVEFIRISTNEEMKEEVIKHFNEADIVIKSAAVADYKIREYSAHKIKKSDGDLELAFSRDSDILMELGSKKEKQILVGFAAESQDLKENAQRKLKKKNLDYIVANDITSNDTGFASEDNKVIILSKEGKQIKLDKMSKSDIASNLFDIIVGKR